MQRIEADVLVVGAGPAGCLAAIEAAKTGLRVVMVDKYKAGRHGSTPTSGAGMCAAMGEGRGTEAAHGDSPELHGRDTLHGGEFMSDPDLVRSMVDGAAELVRELETFGVFFSKTADGRYIQDRQMGHSYGRTCTVMGGGPRLMNALRKEMLSRGVQVVERVKVTHLFTDGDRATGAFGLDMQGPNGYLFTAQAVVLATGGATALYPYASASYLTTGDGLALAYAAGAELAHMEFVEFTVIPKVGDHVLSTAGISPMVGLGVHIRNRLGERFLERYDPKRMERTTRGQLVQAIYREMVEGRGPCLNDPTPVPPAEWDRRVAEEGKAHLIYKLRSMGLDPAREPFAWVPAVHTFLGGVVVDGDRMSRVPGLFATGEVATGLHGANRLSANAITDCVVSGKRCGFSAARWARSHRRPEVPARAAANAAAALGLGIDQPRHPRYREIPALRAIQAVAWDHLAMVRNATGLASAIAAAAELRAQLAGPPRVTEWVDLIRQQEVANLALVGEMIARSALARTESRGQHFRQDFPVRDDANWLKWVKVSSGSDGAMAVRIEPAPGAALAQIATR